MGQPSFLPGLHYPLDKEDNDSVNALIGAAFISTDNSVNVPDDKTKSVNALIGAAFISTINTMKTNDNNMMMCQCPDRGGLHFYGLEKQIDEMIRDIVSMP